MKYIYLLLFVCLIILGACSGATSVSTIKTHAGCQLESSYIPKIKFYENKKYILYAKTNELIKYSTLSKNNYSIRIDSVINNPEVLSITFEEVAKKAKLPPVSLNIEKLITYGEFCIFSKAANQFISDEVLVKTEKETQDEQIKTNFEALINGNIFYSSYSISK